jgi:hypothetical protein
VAPLMVTHGSRKLSVTKAGFEPYTDAVTIKGRGSLSVQVKLREAAHIGTLSVAAGAGDTIRVDGALVGSGDWRGSLPSGTHRVDVEADGKEPYGSKVIIRDGQTESLRITLAEKSGSHAWLWIGGGVVLAAGLTVGGYFLFRDDTKDPKQGTLPPGSIELPLGF